MRALVSLTDNCENNPVWDGCSCSNENSAPGLLLVSFLMDPDLFYFIIHCLLIAVPNIHVAKRGTLSFKFRNIDGKTPGFASINMDLGWRLDHF